MANTTTATQAYLNGVLMGVGTAFPFVSVEPTQEIRSHNLVRLLADGDYQGNQQAGPLFITLTLNITGTSLANLFANRETLRAAWTTSGTDLTFELNEPSVGSRTLQGRVSDFKLPPFDASQEAALRIYGVLAQFEAGTPTWT